MKGYVQHNNYYMNINDEILLLTYMYWRDTIQLHVNFNYASLYQGCTVLSSLDTPYYEMSKSLSIPTYL